VKHLYGIFTTNPAFTVTPDLAGVHGARVHTIVNNGLTALVSDSDVDDYSRLYKPALVQLLAAHQRVTESAMAQVPALLPTKFGTVLQPAEIQLLLTQFHADLQAALQALVDKVELEVVVTWQPERLFAEMAQEPTIAQLCAAAATMSPAEVQQLQIVVGQLVKAAIDQRRATYQAQILGGLRPLADDVECNPVFNDQVVTNLACLISSTRQAEFDRQVEALDRELAGQLNFKIVGPLPAYSFSTLEVVKADPDDIEWACKQLGLGDTASADEIRAAYRRAARHYHPDVAPNDALAAERFDEINEAHQLVQHYYTAQAQRMSAGQNAAEFRCDFSGTGVANTLLVNLCRSSELAS
jgi:DnaJ-domain-containing protein 1